MRAVQRADLTHPIRTSRADLHPVREQGDTMTATITLSVRTFPVRPPEHAEKSPCVCTECWREYIDWYDRQDELSNPAA
jgi:hypothetical protein